MKINFTDYLITFSQVTRMKPSSLLTYMLSLFLPPSLSLSLKLNSDFVQDILAVQSLDMSKYLRLFVPAVEWILQCLAHKGTEVRKGGHGCIGGRGLIFNLMYFVSHFLS